MALVDGRAPQANVIPLPARVKGVPRQYGRKAADRTAYYTRPLLPDSAMPPRRETAGSPDVDEQPLADLAFARELKKLRYVDHGSLIVAALRTRFEDWATKYEAAGSLQGSLAFTTEPRCCA